MHVEGFNMGRNGSARQHRAGTVGITVHYPEPVRRQLKALALDEGRTIGDDDPVMLRTAAELAFPDGSMTEVGLRKMRDRGLLVVERIAGRDYTTLAEIQAMRERCRAASKARAADAQRRNDPQADSERAQAAALATIERLRARAALRASAERLRHMTSKPGKKPRQR